MPNSPIQTLQWMVEQRLLLFMPDFLALEDRQLFLAEARNSPVLPAPVDEYAQTQERPVQRQTQLLEISASLEQESKQRFAQVAPFVNQHFGLELQRQERPQFLRYAVGDFFKPHTDSYDHPIYRERRISFILCLNDHADYQGGRLAFFLRHPSQPERFLGVPVPPAAGLLIAFRSDLLHEVSPVTAGERLTVVTWLAE